MTRPISDILEELDDCADAVAHLPARFVPRDKLQALHADVQSAIARPAEGERVIDDFADWLCRALIHIATPPTEPKWLRLAKALHHQVKDDLRRAREEELRQMRDGR
jgi:hypothetical protein